MTGRISMRPPGVFTFNNFSAEAVEKPIVAPDRYQHWIDKISAERLEANFSEMFERAILFVYEVFGFNDKAEEQRQVLATHILFRLDSIAIELPRTTTSLGALIREELQHDVGTENPIIYDDNFKNLVQEYFPRIAKRVADECYIAVEPEILDFVRSHRAVRTDDEITRAFIRDSIEEVAEIALCQNKTVNFDELLIGLANALYVVGEAVKQRTSLQLIVIRS